jgi:hypothetical protein
MRPVLNSAVLVLIPAIAVKRIESAFGVNKQDKMKFVCANFVE